MVIPSVGTGRADITQSGRDQKPNLLFFSNHLRGPHGSAGARSWHQAKCLANRFQVSVILPMIDPVTAKLVTQETFSGLPDSVDVRLIRVTDNDRSSLLRRALYYLSAMPKQLLLGLRVPRPKIVLSMGLPVTTLGIAWITSVLRRAYFVVDVRDLPFDTAAELGYLKNRHFIGVLRGLEGFLLRRADAVLVISPRHKPHIAERGVDAKRITIASVGYDNFEETPKNIITEWRTALQMDLAPETQLIGVYSGTLGYAFPVEEILEGAKKLTEDKRFGFVFLGDGQRLDEFRNFANTHKLNAHFTGRVNKRDVMAICRAAGYCIYPANRGTFSSAILGNKVFDYLGAGQPVLYVGEDSAVWDLIDELDAGLYVGLGNPEGFADAARQLLNDPDCAVRLRNGASQLVSRGYTAEASAEKLLEVIENVIGMSQSSAPKERD